MAPDPAGAGAAGPAPAHAVYFCRIVHVRLRPFRHAFAYRAFTLLLDLDRLDRLPRGLSHNRFNLLSLHDADHGPRDGSPLRPWVEAQLAAAGLDLGGGPIRLLALPRVLGACFNPLSLYFCHDPAGRLRAVLYEVKNTFGDQHCYLCPVDPDQPAGAALEQGHEKEFHVSPFMPLDGHYAFRLLPPGEQLGIRIRLADADGDRLIATQTGRRLPLTGRSLLRAVLTHPLQTLKVVGGIHWQALHLWRKGAPFHRRPDPPVRLARTAR